MGGAAGRGDEWGHRAEYLCDKGVADDVTNNWTVIKLEDQDGALTVLEGGDKIRVGDTVLMNGKTYRVLERVVEVGQHIGGGGEGTQIVAIVKYKIGRTSMP